MMHIENAGGFVGTDAYFRMVQPLLDLLEVEIQCPVRAGHNAAKMKRSCMTGSMRRSSRAGKEKGAGNITNMCEDNR